MARHLLGRAPRPSKPLEIAAPDGDGPSIVLPSPMRQAVSAAGAKDRTSTLTVPLLGGLASAAVFWTAVLLARLRRRSVRRRTTDGVADAKPLP